MGARRLWLDVPHKNNAEKFMGLPTDVDSDAYIL